LARPTCAGSEDVTRDRRCAHLAPSVTLLEPRALCDAVATRTSGGAACSPALGVPLPRDPGPPPLARTGAPPSLVLYIGKPPQSTWEPLPLLWIEEPPHRASVSGNRGHRSHRLGVHHRARSRATAIVARAWVGADANESG
jgi:hypothetical protein